MSLRWLLVVSLLGCAPKAPAVVGWDASTLPPVPDDLDAPYPVDPGVRIGKLPNGLTFYIEPNQRPQRRAELRMVVKAGSVLEDDDQLGIAHFVEHMAFNGSLHFPEQEAISRLEAFGARFGAHVNASTSFDETIYKLQVPTDNPRAVETALTVFADQASALTFDAAECDRERGVVLEEWRLDQGLPQRIQDATLPLLFHESRYLERLPIGTGDSLMTFDCAEAREFWQTWYRPDLMAVMVAGDIDVDEVERLVRKLFEPLQNPVSPRPREWYRVPDHDETLVSVFADPEITASSVSVMDKVDVVEQNRHGAYIDYFIQQFAWIALNERLAVIAQDPRAPIVGAGAGEGALGHERGLHTVVAQAREGRELEALRLLLTELERAHRYGFTDAEIERARDAIRLNMEQYVAQKNTTDNLTLVDEHIRVFLEGEPMPGVDYEAALTAKFLGRITTEQINGWVTSSFFTGQSRVLEMELPQKLGLSVPTTDAMRALAAEVASSEIAAPVAEAALEPLMADLPKPGVVRDLGADPALGTVTWQLGNGIKVMVKQTDFVADQVVFRAISPGGTSLVSDADYASALLAPDILSRSGLGSHDAVNLARHLAGKDVGVEAFVGSEFEGLVGGAREADLETLLQLVHLHFVAPRFDDVAVDLEKTARLEDLRNRSSSPEAVFWDTWSEIVYQGNHRYTNWKPDELSAVSRAAAAAAWQDRFGDAGDFTFVFAGSASPEELRPLVARYLASLPTKGRVEQWKDDGVRPPAGQVERTLSSGGTPRAHVVLRFHGPFESTPERRNALDGVTEVLGSVLRGELREELGGTYGVGVTADVDDFPVPTYNLDVEFECDPDRVEELTAAMWQMIELVRIITPSKEGVAVMREQRTRDFETVSHDNVWWVRQITGAIQRGEDPRRVLDTPKLQAALDGGKLKAMAQEVLRRDNYVLLVQRPSGAGDAAAPPASDAATPAP
jgi:zinc protease